MKEHARLVVATLLFRPLPPHLAADLARVRRVRWGTWVGYGYLAVGAGWLVGVGTGKTVWVHWFLGVGFLGLGVLQFVTVFSARRGIRPRRPNVR